MLTTRTDRRRGRPCLANEARREYAVCLMFTAAEWKQLREYRSGLRQGTPGKRGTLGARLRELVLREILRAEGDVRRGMPDTPP